MKQANYRLDELGNTELSHNVYRGDSNLSEADLEDYSRQIRDALTSDGNLCEVYFEDSVISISGNLGGNIQKFFKIVNEMYGYGCRLEMDNTEKKYIVEAVKQFRATSDYDAGFSLTAAQILKAAKDPYLSIAMRAVNARLSNGKVHFPDAESRQLAIDYLQQFKNGDLYNIVGHIN